MTTLLDWLQEEDCPPVRYRVAKQLLDVPPDHLAEMKADVLAWPPLVRILARQRDDGAWPWRAKSRTAQSTFVALQLMAACGLTVDDEPVAAAIEALNTFHQPKKHPGVVSYLSGGSGVLPCYAGIATQSLIQLGAVDHPLVAGSVQWLVDHQRFDHRENRAGGASTWPYATPGQVGCWADNVSCYHGVVGALRALAFLPPDRRSPAVRQRLEEAIDYLRAHRVFEKSREPKPILRHLLRFFVAGEYRSDLLDVLDALSHADPDLGHRGWILYAIDAVEARTDDGRVPWLKSYAGRVADPLDFETIGEPSRFLTLQWLLIKRRFGLTD